MKTLEIETRFRAGEGRRSNTKALIHCLENRKKFRLLKAAYLAFMVALLTGVGAYLLVFGWLLRTAP